MLQFHPLDLLDSTSPPPLQFPGAVHHWVCPNHARIFALGGSAFGSKHVRARCIPFSAQIVLYRIFIPTIWFYVTRASAFHYWSVILRASTNDTVVCMVWALLDDFGFRSCWFCVHLVCAGLFAFGLVLVPPKPRTIWIVFVCLRFSSFGSTHSPHSNLDKPNLHFLCWGLLALACFPSRQLLIIALSNSPCFHVVLQSPAPSFWHQIPALTQSCFLQSPIRLGTFFIVFWQS